MGSRKTKNEMSSKNGTVAPVQAVKASRGGLEV